MFCFFTPTLCKRPIKFHLFSLGEKTSITEKNKKDADVTIIAAVGDVS